MGGYIYEIWSQALITAEMPGSTQVQGAKNNINLNQRLQKASNCLNGRQLMPVIYTNGYIT